MPGQSYPVLTVTTPPALKENVLCIVWQFDLLGLEEIAEKNETVYQLYFSTREEQQRCSKRLRKEFSGSGILLEWDECNEGQWRQSLHGGFDAVRAGELTILPYNPDEERATGADAIYIYPGRGYGTGVHATTNMCLRFITEMELTGSEFLDFGCGSGVLSLAALRRGAKGGVAIDSDPDAVENAAYNLEINDAAEQISLNSGSLKELRNQFPGRAFPVVFANLNSGIIPPLLEAGLGSLVAPGGMMVLSGIHVSTVAEISALFPVYGFAELKWKRQRQWTTALLVQANDS